MKKTLILLSLLMIIPFSVRAQSLESMNKPIMEELDEITPFSDGLAAVRKGQSWGFINTEGTLVIDFRDDLVWNAQADPDALGIESVKYPRFTDGRCMIRAKGDDEIPVFGFIDTSGNTIIAPEYLNLTEFRDGRALGILVKKTFRGKNKFQLNIYDYSFTEVVLNPQGEILWPIREPQNILMVAVLFLAVHLMLRFGALGIARHSRPFLIASIAWGLYTAWEWLVQTNSPKANIRVDLLLIWPVLAILSAWELFRAFR